LGGLVADCGKWLSEVDIVPSGRYGLRTYFWSDEAILGGKKAADLASRRLSNLRKPAMKAQRLGA
jgi:hypothetical protein